MLPNIDPLALTIILTFILIDTINQCPNAWLKLEQIINKLLTNTPT